MNNPGSLFYRKSLFRSISLGPDLQNLQNWRKRGEEKKGTSPFFCCSAYTKRNGAKRNGARPQKEMVPKRNGARPHFLSLNKMGPGTISLSFLYASLTPILFVLSFIEDEMGFFQAFKKEGQSIIKGFDIFSEFIF